MAYIGNDLRSNEDYKIIDDISSGFNGSETSFALQVGGATPVPFPKFEQQLLISVNGVIQEPDPTGSAGFKLLGTNIVFSSAPTNGHAFFGVIYAGADYVNAGGTFPDGSINFPSITFSADTNTGFTRTASGTVALISDGTKVAQFPTSQGSSGQALITDGGGNLSFGIPTNIVNANINASAAIAGTKISPDFGSQAIATTGSATIGTDLIHAGDTDTKISFGTDTIAVATNGVTRMTFTGNFIDLPDAGTLRLGNSNDLQISHGSGGASNIVHSNTSQPLKISATGSGNIAFLTDSNERMRVDSAGRLLIGTTTNTFTGVGSSRLQVSGTGADTAGANFIRTSNDGGGAYLQFTKNRGSATQSGDTVGAISWMGHDGTDTESYFAQILVKAEANATNNNTQGSIRFGTSNGSSVTSERMRLTHDGKVGIGIQNPTGKFAVSDGTVVAEINPFSSSSGAFIGTRSNHHVLFKTNATERMRLTNDGPHLLLGGTTDVNEITETSSSSGLVIGNTSMGNGGLAIINSTTGTGRIYFGDALGADAGRNQGQINYYHNGNYMLFATAGSERMRITNGGTVGIGNTNPQRTFQINATNPGIRLEENSGSSKRMEMFVRVSDSTGVIAADQSSQQIAFRTAGSDRFNINMKGAVNTLFNDGDSVGVIHKRVQGSNSHNFFEIRSNGSTPLSGGTLQFAIETDGDVKNTNNSYGSLSDIKLKENIVDAKSQWDDIKALKVRNYNFKSGLDFGTYTQIGLIAQEVEEISAGLVVDNIDRDDEGKDLGTVTKTLRYSVLHIKALKALQEAMAKIETLETEVAALKAS